VRCRHAPTRVSLSRQPLQCLTSRSSLMRRSSHVRRTTDVRRWSFSITHSTERDVPNSTERNALICWGSWAQEPYRRSRFPWCEPDPRVSKSSHCDRTFQIGRKRPTPVSSSVRAGVPSLNARFASDRGADHTLVEPCTRCLGWNIGHSVHVAPRRAWGDERWLSCSLHCPGEGPSPPVIISARGCSHPNTLRPP
jgi:hypothetical protein